MRLLVTGATGFVGGHLIRMALSRPGVEILGLSRTGRMPGDLSDLADRVKLVSLDLLDRPALRRLLAGEKPTHIVHLAGVASLPRAQKDPLAAWEANLTATLHLYQELVELNLSARFLYVSTGQVYGNHFGDVVLGEDTPFRPNNPYAASKLAADLAGYQYSVNPGLDILRARPFNHIGPGQTAEYAVGNFARQLVAIERGEQEPMLEVGNLQPRRDITDVRDIVAAYLLLLEKGEKGQAYNVASGETLSMQEILDRLIALTGLKVEVRVRSDLVRAVDLSVPQVDTSRLRQTTGWKPSISLDRTLRDVLDGWRNQSKG
jgi:GDP-4-dehydro-6-deoxy-D-mannose reductase